MDRPGGYDHPRETDQPREKPGPWWRDHYHAEIDITAPTRANPAEAAESCRARWHDDHGTPPDQRPAPFRLDVAEKVLPADKSGGAHGRLDLHDGRTGIPLDSGRKTGLVDALRQQRGDLPAGFTGQNQAHVEAHVSAYLRLHPEISEATLYVNRQPCPGPRGCADNLPAMLPENATLTVYAPKGWVKVYHGAPDQPRP